MTAFAPFSVLSLFHLLSNFWGNERKHYKDKWKTTNSKEVHNNAGCGTYRLSICRLRVAVRVVFRSPVVFRFIESHSLD